MQEVLLVRSRLSYQRHRGAFGAGGYHRQPLRIVRFSGEALSEGVEKHTIDGIPVRITCPARTIADCFKYRNKIGLDVAVEALRDCRQQRKCTMDDLWRYAKLCRVSNVIRPYVEAMA